MQSRKIETRGSIATFPSPQLISGRTGTRVWGVTHLQTHQGTQACNLVVEPMFGR